MNDDIEKNLAFFMERAINIVCNSKGLVCVLARHHKEILNDIGKLLEHKGISISSVISECAILASKHDLRLPERRHRNKITFFVVKDRPEDTLVFSQSSKVNLILNPINVRKCIIEANLVLERIHDLSLIYGVEIFELLGLRNLSAFVGQVMVKVFKRNHDDILIENPNQDGYPDLCALTPEGVKYIRERASNPDGSIRADKELWSPYPYGGLEIKATCGNTPPASQMPKPLIGESRYPTLVSAEWKAHHQETKVLLGIFWDFVDGLATILGSFFRNDLDTRIGKENKDWGSIIHPREGGGRTTSVSIMKKGRSDSEGVRKMGRGWVVLPRDEKILKSMTKVFYLEKSLFT